MTEDKTEMGYRERLCWASLAAVALVDTLYFCVVFFSSTSDQPLTASGLLQLLGLIALILLAVELGAGWLYRRSREPLDERDELIAARAARFAYGVFVIGVILALVVDLMSATDAANVPQALPGLPYARVHLVLVCLVSAELVRHGYAVLCYRRGH